jgi:type IV secretion system protein VirB2
MVAMALALVFIEPAFAAISWDIYLKSFFWVFIRALQGVGVAVITVAFMFSGYQIAFGGKSITSLIPIIIGAIVIGGAAALAGTLI